MLYSKFDYLNQETVFSARKIGSPDGDPEGVPNEGPEGVHQGVQIGGEVHVLYQPLLCTTLSSTFNSSQ